MRSWGTLLSTLATSPDPLLLWIAHSRGYERGHGSLCYFLAQGSICWLPPFSDWLRVLPVSGVSAGFHPEHFLNSTCFPSEAIQIAVCPLLSSAPLIFTGYLVCGWDTDVGQG